MLASVPPFDMAYISYINQDKRNRATDARVKIVVFDFIFMLETPVFYFETQSFLRPS